MNCPNCGYEFDVTENLQCPRCGDRLDCGSVSCGECDACSGVLGSVRKMVRKGPGNDG